MVMTIGELHTGHCIDPSLADAVQANATKSVVRNAYVPVIGRCGRSQSLDNTPSQGNFRLHPTCRMGNGSRWSDRSSASVEWTNPAVVGAAAIRLLGGSRWLEVNAQSLKVHRGFAS